MWTFGIYIHLCSGCSTLKLFAVLPTNPLTKVERSKSIPQIRGATDGLADTRFNLGTSQTDNRTAEEYWQDELVTRDPSTRQNYLGYFRMFQQFVKMNSDQLLAQRIQDGSSQDKKIQRRAESMFRQFLAYMRDEKKYAPTTLQ